MHPHVYNRQRSPLCMLPKNLKSHNNNRSKERRLNEKQARYIFKTKGIIFSIGTGKTNKVFGRRLRTTIYLR